MTNTLIYMDGNLIDLDPETVIAITFQAIKAEDLSTRRIVFSNSIKIPWTPANHILFGFLSNLHSLTSKPYAIQRGKVVQEGLEVIPDANIFVKKSRDRDFSIEIFENSFDFFASIKEKKINELAIIADSGWEAADIDAARATTSGIIAAVIMWSAYPSIYEVDRFLPSFYYHTIITSILEATGLTLSGSILTDPRFTDLIIPFFTDKLEYPSSFYSQFARYQGTSNHPVTNAVNNETIAVGLLMTAETHGTFVCHIAIGGITWNGGGTLTLRIRKNGSLVDSILVATNPAPGGLADLSVVDFVNPGDLFEAYVYSDDMAAPGIDYTITNSTFLRFIPDGKVNRTLVNWTELMPEIKVTDFLKDFFVRFGIVYKQVGGVLILKTLEEIIQDTAGALDWTDKLVNVKDQEIDFGTSYGQNNHFNYSDSIDDEAHGRGNLTIANNKLDLNKELFGSVFENSKDTYVNTFLFANVPVYEDPAATIDQFANSPGVKLLTLKNRVNENAITFDATPRTDFKVGYFLDASLAKDTGFQYFVNEFYPSLAAALQRTKIITKYFNLSVIDVMSYDPFKMVYDGTGYYIVNKISNYVPGKVTRVELFKVSL